MVQTNLIRKVSELYDLVYSIVYDSIQQMPKGLTDFNNFTYDFSEATDIIESAKNATGNQQLTSLLQAIDLIKILVMRFDQLIDSNAYYLDYEWYRVVDKKTDDLYVTINKIREQVNTKLYPV